MSSLIQQLGIRYWFRVLLTFLYIDRLVRYSSIIRLAGRQSLSAGT